MKNEVRAPDVGAKIREIRQRLNMNQRQFADLCGLSQGMIGQWEGSSGKIPGREALDKIVAATGVSRDWLMEGSGPEVDAIRVSDPDEIDLVLSYRRLPGDGKKNARKIFDMVFDPAGMHEKKRSPAKG